jgi:undecaprenyl-diphosphatase
MDYSFYKYINGLTGNAFIDGLFKILAKDLPAAMVAIVALTFLIPWANLRCRRRDGAVLGTVSAGLALLVNQPITHLVDRTRPYVAHPAHSHLLIAPSADPSFPSDHATGGFALAFGVWLYDRAIGSALLVVAAVLSFSRVYVGTHYPGDVLAGALVGIAMVGALYFVAPTRRLVEWFALRAGRVWDGLLRRGSSPHHA